MIRIAGQPSETIGIGPPLDRHTRQDEVLDDRPFPESPEQAKIVETIGRRTDVDRQVADLVPGWLKDIPMGRMAEVTDLQGSVVYLASEASDYVTGHDLIIDGGFTIW